MKPKTQASTSPLSGKEAHAPTAYPKLKKIRWKPTRSALPGNHEGVAIRGDPLREERQARSQARTILDVWLNTDRQTFNEYLEASPPLEPLVVDHLVSLALNTNHPERGHRLAKMKAEKLYKSAKTEVLVQWKKYRGSPNYKGKNHFALYQAKTLKDSNGKSIAKSTILGWLPKLKK